MIFEKIELENIGVYDGKNSISLQTKGSKNIVLIGGENGCGKTTIIDAIKLCLYGNNFTGYTKLKYEKFISEFIRFNKDKASISVRININGDRYTILREWTLNDRLKENLVILKNSELLSDINQNQWQDFIIKMVPLKLINFFLFDGEKIEKMVNDFEETEFSKDIKQILGITVLEDLDGYLNILYRKYLRSINSNSNPEYETIQGLSELYGQKEKLMKEIEVKAERKTEIKKEISYIEELIQKKKREYFGKLEVSMKSVDDLEKAKFLLGEDLKRLEQALRDIISKEAPYILAFDLFSELISQLKIENSIRESLNYNKLLQTKSEQVIELLSKHNVKVNDELLSEIRNILSHRVPDGALIHNLPDSWFSFIYDTYNSLSSTKENLSQIYRTFLEKESELQRIEKFFDDIKSVDFLSDYIEEILSLERERENKLNEVKVIDEQIKNLEKNIQKIHKQITELEDKSKELKKTNRVFDLISNLRPLIVDIKNNILINKVDNLRKEILYGIKMLLRKENFIEDLNINISDFRIRIYNREGKELEFSRLSAGERQMFAIAFLWGLMRASGKKLPVVIDTPLGRLDYTHRVKIVRNFLPYVSHQVVILSTNTEIDGKLLKEMEKFISKSYTLEYNSEYLRTDIKEGYFSKYTLWGTKP